MKDQSKTKQALIQELDFLRHEIEELKKAKSEWENERDGLKRSEARFRSYFDLPLYGIAITSPEKGWIEVNDRICSILGYSREEIVRMTWTEMTQPDDLAADLEQFNRVLSRQTDHYHMEKRFIRKDGKVICTNLSVGCVRKPDGNVDHIVAVVEDITSVKLAEEELQASEEKYRSLFDNSIDAVLLATPDGSILAANPEACRIFQRNEEEICRIGRAGLMDLTDPRLTAALEGRARTGRFQGELTFIRKDGTTFPGEVSSVIFRDHDGQLKTSMIVRDMSEKRKREQDYQSLFREMLNGFAVHEIICDTQGNPVDYRFLTVNPAFERITGLKAEHIVGRTVLEVLPDTEPYWIETYGHVALTGEPTLFEDYSKALNKYFVVTAFQSAPNQFACNFIDITERKRAEVELQANKAQLSSALEMAHLGHWEYDVANDLFTFNDQFYKIFRTTAGQVGGYTMHAAEYADRFVHPEDMHRVEEETRKAIETTDPHFNRQLEHRILYADGTVGYTTVRFFIVKDSHGRTVKTYGVNQDITERKRSEEALRESENKYRLLAENVKDVIFVLDMNLNYTYISPSVKILRGYEPEEILMQPAIAKTLTPSSLDLAMRTYAEIMDLEKSGHRDIYISRTLQLEMIRKDGTTVWTEVMFSLIRDENQRPVGILGLTRDITERKRVEEYLSQSEKKYRELYDFLPIPVYEMDFESNIISANRAIYETFRGTEEDLEKGFKAWQLLSPEEVDKSAQNIKRLLQGEPIGGTEYALKRLDGSVFPAIVISSVIYRDGKPQGLRGAIIDITERKKMEEHLRENEEIMRYIIQYDPNAIAIYDRNLRYIAVSNRYLQDYNVKEADIIGKHHYEVFPEMPQRWKDVHARCLAGAIERNDDDHFERPDGSITYNRWECRPWHRSNGEIGGIITYTEVTTERKQAEIAIKESEKKFRTLTQNTPDIISRIDREGRHVFINKAIEKVTNLTVEDYLGKTNEELGMPRESLVLWNHQFKKAFETGKPVNFEFDFPSPGGIRSFFSTVVPEFDEEGRVSTLLVLARDITDRKESMEKLRKALEATVRAVAVTVETRDPYTAGHQRGVADLSRAIAMELKLTSDRIDGIQMAAMVHDLGKISVPADILSKPTKLTEVEFELIKAHSQSGYDILKDIDFPWPIARMILEHHERMDGSGYPRKLRGDDILLESRILAVADVVESMASHRPYRPALGFNAALEEIEKNRGTAYDADAVDACLKLIRENRFQFGRA